MLTRKVFLPVLQPKISDPASSSGGHRRKVSVYKGPLHRFPSRYVYAIAKDSDDKVRGQAKKDGKKDTAVTKQVIEDLERFEVPKDAWQRHLRNAYQFYPQFRIDTRQQLQKEYAHRLSSTDWHKRLENARDRFLYNYYNWRKDAWNDLIIFSMANLTFVVLGGLLKAVLTELLTGVAVSNSDVWRNIYQVGVLMFGNSFPDKAATVLDQFYSLLVAGVGLGGFALSLALVEQVVLENLDANVKQGSQVYEQDHLVILIWGKSQRDIEVAQRIMEQAAVAYKNTGGKAIVVLCHREKLEMEEFYRTAIPEDQRHGCKLVFRQGSPLDAQDLEVVAASKSDAVIIISDSSRSPEEADAQVVRSAILLDELGYPGPGQQDTRDAVIIAEIRTVDALPLVQFACSPRVIAFPTNLNNARSLCRLVGHPVVAMLGQVVWDFKTHCTVDIRNYPEVTGITFGEVHFYFPSATVAGILEEGYNRCIINPPHDTIIGPTDDLITLRPVVDVENFAVLTTPVEADLGSWVRPKSMGSCEDDDEECMVNYSTFLLDRSMDKTFDWEVTVVEDEDDSLEGIPNSGLHTKPNDVEAGLIMGVLVIGWGEPSFMSDLLRELDHGPSALPYGSLITLYNAHATKEVTRHLNHSSVRNLHVRHVQGNPFSLDDLRRMVDIRLYNNAVVLCDIQWLDPDGKISNGIEVHNVEDMMRIDAQIMMVQLNIRKLLQENGLPDIGIICEKTSVSGGTTRFEDEIRQPMSVTVKFTSYSAELLMQVAHNPQVMFPLFTWGAGESFMVQDVSLLARLNEKLSYWELMARALALGQILVGYCEIPPPDKPNRTVEVMLNPQGVERRNRRRVWNYGRGRVKVICVAPVRHADEAAELVQGAPASTKAMDSQIKRWAKFRLQSARSMIENGMAFGDYDESRYGGTVVTGRPVEPTASSKKKRRVGTRGTRGTR